MVITDRWYWQRRLSEYVEAGLPCTMWMGEENVINEVLHILGSYLLS